MTRNRKDTLDLERVLEWSMTETEESRPPVLALLTGWVAAVCLVAVAAGSLIAPAGMAVAAGTTNAVNYWDSLPTDLPLEVSLPQHTVLLDKNGEEFARLYSENRIDVDLDDISPHFTEALVSTEDARFREHGGADFAGIARAFASNLLNGTHQGGSTITQQLVQNILINNARDKTEESVAVGTTYNDKLREVRYATALEDRLSKDEILNMYANTVYFGNGAYGVEAASIIYFNKHAKNLSPSQGAMLVGMLKGPSLYDPFVNPEKTRQRRNVVLSRLAATGTLTIKQAEAAQAEPLGLDRGRIDSSCAQSDYPFYCSLVRKEILTDPAFGDTREERADRLTRGGMTLTTALDPEAMKAADDAVTRALGNDNRAALGVAVVKPGTGRITAIGQNREWGTGDGRTQIVYADSAFQPGSTMKPITLATALEQGIPATTEFKSDSPYVSPTLDSPPGGFINFGNYDYGYIHAREAIKKSVNTYFIQLIQRTGVLPVADMAARLGVTTFPRTGPGAISGVEASLTLGAYGATPIEMANAYATFIADGVQCRPHTITGGVRSSTGEKVDVPEPDCHQAIAPAVADTVADALKEPFKDGGTLDKVGGLDNRPSGAKTGTTDGNAENWIVGLTPQYSTAVWLGDPRGSTLHPLDVVHAYGQTFYNLTGSEVAAPVWIDVMNRIHRGLPVRSLPNSNDAATSSTTARSIPDVRGLSVDEAITVLLQNGLTPGIDNQTAQPDPLLGPDVVSAQTPAPGSSRGYKQTVTLTLTDGSDTSVRIPSDRQEHSR